MYTYTLRYITISSNERKWSGIEPRFLNQSLGFKLDRKEHGWWVKVVS